MDWMSRFCSLNWNAEVRATTRRLGILASTEMISSVMPSEKNSCDASPERFAKGNTAMEIALAGEEETVLAASTPAGCCVVVVANS